MVSRAIETASRRLNTAGPAAIDQVLLAQFELEARSDAAVGAEMEALYFAPADDHAQVMLTVGGQSCATVAGEDPAFRNDRGGALLRQVTAAVQKALVATGKPVDIAYVRARDIVRHLGCRTFVSADHVLATQNNDQTMHRQAIDMSIDGDTVRIHKTTTYARRKPARSDGPLDSPVTQVVDLAMQFKSTKSGVEAEVTNVAVRVADSPDALVESLVEATKTGFGVPDVATASSCFPACIRRLYDLLAGLFGARGIKLVYGDAEAIARVDPAAVARPVGISLDSVGLDADFDKTAWLASARKDYGRFKAVLTYRYDNNNVDVIRSPGPALDAQTQRKAIDEWGRAVLERKEGVLRADRQLDFGSPWTFWGVPSLPEGTYRYGAAPVAELAQDVAQAAGPGDQGDAKLFDALRPTLEGALFPAHDAKRYVIEVDGENIMDDGMRGACVRLGELEELDSPVYLHVDLPEVVKLGRLPSSTPVDQIEKVKTAMYYAMLARVKEACPNEATQRQMFATIARGAAAMQVLRDVNGEPTIKDNRYETYRIAISTCNTMPALGPGAVAISFESEHSELGAEAKVYFGDQFFKKDALRSARSVTTAFFKVTDHDIQMKYATCQGRLVLKDEGKVAAQRLREEFREMEGTVRLTMTGNRRNSV